MNEALASHPAEGGAVASAPGTAGDAPGQPRQGVHPLVGLLEKVAGDTAGLEVLYEALDLVAKHFELDDVLVAVDNDTVGRQVFRLGRLRVGPAELDRLGEGREFASTPDSVPRPTQSLVAGIAAVALAADVARRQLVRDRATGLLSRAVFNEALRSAAAQSSRYGWIFTVMVLQVAGDRPAGRQLRRLGYAFGRALRTGDTGGRLRDATFTALLPNATAESLHALVGRFSAESGVPVESIQFASATAPKDSVDPAELFRLAATRLRES